MSSPTSEEPSEPPLFTRGFALTLLTQFAFGFAFSSFFLLPKFVVTQLSGTASQVGYVGAMAVLAAALISPLCGKLLDRGRRRPIIVIGCALSGLAALPYVLVDEVGPLIYLLRVVQGISYTLYFVGATTLVADLAPPARLGQALGWFGSAGLLMNAIATVIAERLAHDFGWRVVFVAAAASGLLGAALSLWLPEPKVKTTVPTERAASSASPIMQRFPILWAAAAGGAGFGVLFTFTQPLALSLGDANVSPLFAGYTAAALFVRLAFGNLADRLGRARVGGAALAIYTLVVASAAALSQGWLWPLGLGFGLAHGAFYPSLNALVLEGVAREARGTIGGYFNAAFNAGVLVVTFGFGQVAQAYGYRIVFLLVACLTVSGCFALLRLTKRPLVARGS
jgi:MFS family permease